MNRYRAFGLHLAAELPLPELRPGRARDPVDAVVRFGSTPEAPGEPGRWLRPSREVAASCYDGSLGISVRQGREIVLEPRGSLPPGVARLPVLGGGLGYLMHQRAQLVLHADVVWLQGRAVALLGARGAGKSTTAAALVRRGHALVADDVVALEGGRVLPGYAWMRLWPDALHALGVSPDPLDRVHPAVEKRWWPARFHPHAVRLQRVLILGTGPEPGVSELRGHASLSALLPHVYAARALHPAERGEVLRALAGLAGRVPVARLERPRDLHRLPALVDCVEAAVLG